MHEIGRGGPLDYAAASNWYRKAAEQGWPPAQANLGLAYVGGIGVSVDLVEADKWLRIAAQRSSGDDRASYDELRGVVERKMSAAQVRAGEERARQWIKAFETR